MFCIEYAIMIRLMPIVVLHADSCRRESSERIDRLSEGDRDPSNDWTRSAIEIPLLRLHWILTYKKPKFRCSIATAETWVEKTSNLD